MNRRTSLAAFAALAASVSPVAAQPVQRAQPKTDPTATTTISSSPSTAVGPGTAEWAGFRFDVQPPLTAYCVEKCEFMDDADNTVKIVLFVDGYEPVGPVEVPARDQFDLEVGDALLLGECGVVNG